MRLSAVDELELRWFAHDSISAMGLRSPMGQQLDRARVRQLFDMGGTPGNPAMDATIAATRRARRVRDRLRAMGNRLAATLLAAYTADRPPGLAKFDRLGPVMLLTVSARAAYAKQRGTDSRVRASTLTRWLAPRMNGPKQIATLRDLVLAESDELLTMAVKRWRDLKTVGR